MWVSPSRTSLFRLLLGAAFVLLGWAFASSTSASADEPGLLGSLTKTVESTTSTLDTTVRTTTKTVDSTLTTTTKALDTTVRATTKTVDDVVAAVPATRPVSKPVKALTSTVEHTTRAVTADVLRPTISTLDETVVTTTDVLTNAVSDTVIDVLQPQLPGVDTPLVPGLDPGTGGPEPVSSTTGRSHALGAGSGFLADNDAVRATPVAAGSWVAPLFGPVEAGGLADPRPAGPSVPEPADPWSSGLDLTGLAPSAGSGSGPVLLFAVLALAVFLLRPEFRCATGPFGRLALRPAPVGDPGSRPD